MKLVRKYVLTFTEEDVIQLQNELDDIGFGAEDGTKRKQSDEKWPTLSELHELLLEE